MRSDVARLVAVSTRMRRLSERPWRIIGVPRGAFITLAMLQEHEAGHGGFEQAPDLTVTELARRHGISKAGMSQLITTLEKQGLVKRCPRSEDKRVVGVRLTAAGQRLMDRACGLFEATMVYLTEQLGPEETEQLCGLLERLCDLIERIDDPRVMTEKEVRCEDSSGI